MRRSLTQGVSAAVDLSSAVSWESVALAELRGLAKLSERRVGVGVRPSELVGLSLDRGVVRSDGLRDSRDLSSIEYEDVTQQTWVSRYR